VLHGRYAPGEFAEAIARYRATICFTVPTYYQQMMRLDLSGKLVSLRLAVSSGEALPLPVREAWQAASGLSLTEVLGSTEMLHAFAGAAGKNVRPGFIGPAIPGYEIAVLDESGKRCAPGEIGRFAVRGPTGCRYMDDPRQRSYVQYGWNLTGDACAMSEDGYVAYHTRYDDMIISAGYNISGLEVENVLLDHPDVAECAVIGEADGDRGQIVAAYVVSKAGVVADAALARALQDHVKAIIAPYKYPRRVVFVEKLPRNESGKIQRFRLREDERAQRI
jgi:2-aminobenzoate-CoA ligase